MRRQRRGWEPLLLGLLALSVRLLFLPGAQVLQTEGTTYVSLARHLLAGRGYVGILGEQELVMVSIFPHLIAALGWLTGDLVLAGRVLALLTSAALVLPVYALAQAMFGGRAGLWAGLLVALHPYLTTYAPLVRVESPFLLVWMVGLYAAWRAWQEGPRSRWGWGVPLAFGLAYLLKSEGAVYFAWTALLLALAWGRRYGWRDTVLTLAAHGALFLILAFPMIAWLSAQTGRFTADTKGIVNYSIAHRIAQGLTYHQAAYGLSAQGTPVGPLLDRNRWVRAGVGPKRPALENPAYRRKMVAVLREEGRRLLWPLVGRFWLLFASLGLITALARGEWRPWLFTGWYVAPALLGVASILFVWTRYLLPVVPLAALWVAYGVDVLADVIVGGFVLSARTARRLHLGLGLVLTLLLVVTHPYARAALRDLGQTRDVEQREVGLWLRAHDPDPTKRIMSTTSQVPFYAEGVHVPMPVDDVERIPTYARLRNVHYVVISEVKDRNRPTAVWLDPEQAPPEWEVIYRQDTPGHRMVVYRVPEGYGCE